MTPPDLPPRADLTSRSKQHAAAVLVRVLGWYETAKERLLVSPIDPADDPFRVAPDGLDALAPGDVIASRPVEIRLARRHLDLDAWQVQFRTTTADGMSASGIATVMLRRGAEGAARRPLLAYQSAVDSLGPEGDPSSTLRRGDHLELPVMLLALRRGWVVVSVDWTGPQHSFVDLPLAARFVLDGIRACLGFGPLDLDAGTPVGLWGYSGGALATLFAAEHHPHYAPEVNVVAAAAGGGGVDVVATPDMFEVGNILSGIPFGACIGASRTFPDFDLDGHLTPHGRRLVDAASDMTMEQLALSFPFVRMSSILTVPTIGDVPGARAAFEVTRCGQATPRAAMFLYHAVHDQATEIADVDVLVEKYRRGGADVTYRRYRFGEHLIVMFRAVPRALRFLTKHLE